MNRAFDSGDFVRDLGIELVREFEKARKATTPGLVGDAMERPVQRRLEQVLPHGVGVGSGCVIDVHGGTSKQMDVVLYEKAVCPVFSINETAGSRYYPCEGVLAVGEVKSRIGKKELADCFEKVASVKRLERHFSVAGDDGQTKYVGRAYGEYGSNTAYGFDRDRTNTGDILGFVVAEKPTLPFLPSDKSRGASLSCHYVANVEETTNDVLCPDIVVFLDGHVLTPRDSGGSDTGARYTPTRIRPVLPHILSWRDSESPFADLIHAIWEWHQNGLTAHVPMQLYLHYSTKPPSVEHVWAPLVHVPKEPPPVSMEETRTPTDHLRHERDLRQRQRKPR